MYLCGMWRLTKEQLDWLKSAPQDAPRHPMSGRPPADKWKVIEGIFRILDSGAKWKGLHKRFDSKAPCIAGFRDGPAAVCAR